MPRMKAYGSFAAWKSDQSNRNKRLIGALQRVVKGVAPHLGTTVKWGQGCFSDGDRHKIFIHAEEDHVQLGFYNGSSLKDPEGLLKGRGKHVRHVAIRTPRDIDPDALAALIVQVTD